MLKKVFMITAMLALSGLFICAFAEVEADGYWSKEGDLHYHGFSGCLGKENLTMQDPSGKAPCPVCVPVSDESTEIRATERGGTLVVRIPDGWVDGFFIGREDFAPDNINTIPIEYFGRTAILTAAQMLSGDDYIGFMNDQKNGNAEAVSISADCYAWRGNGDGVSMNLRHIDGAWYDITHDFSGDDDDWKLSFSVNATKVWTEGDVLLTQHCDSDGEDALIPVESMKGAKPVFSGEYDNLTISIYDTLETHIAVFHEPDGNSDVLKDVGLDIGVHMTDILMNGYMSGKTAVFCCVLTDAEVSALESGAIPELVRPSLAEGADFMGSSYAAVRTDEDKHGVINAAGEWVVSPTYDLIDHGHHKSEKKYFLCWTRSGKKAYKVTVLDGDSLEKLFEVGDKSCFGSCVENPSILCLYPKGEGSNAAYYLLPTGEKLFEEDDFYDGCAYVSGFYGESVEGYPQRIVIQNNSADRGAYLADNHRNPVTGEYAHIISLFWAGEKGLYLVEQFSGTRGWCGSYASGELYDGRYEYAKDDYLCGLIDQDGNAVTPIQYVSIEIISRNEILLTRPDGEVDVITSDMWM